MRAAFISSGTVLNLLSGKKPACGGRACTASGASSFSMFSRSAGESPPAEVRPSSSSGSAPGFSSGDGGSVPSGITSWTVADTAEQLLPQHVMQLAEDEVVGRVDADLARALVEIAAVEVGHGRGRPGRHLLVEQARRPAAPVERASADRVGEPFERNRRIQGTPQTSLCGGSGCGAL